MNIHGIIIIKNDDKYLQYYDERWDSYLFLNTKLGDEFTDLDIIEYVEKTLNKNVTDCCFIKCIEHSKYSVSHNKMRDYKHYFYSVNLEDYELDSKYKFFSMDELKSNNRVMEVNSDIVNFIDNMKI